MKEKKHCIKIIIMIKEREMVKNKFTCKASPNKTWQMNHKVSSLLSFYFVLLCSVCGRGIEYWRGNQKGS